MQVSASGNHSNDSFRAKADDISGGRQAHITAFEHDGMMMMMMMMMMMTRAVSGSKRI